MVEFLATIRSDADLTLLWRTVLATANDNELKESLLVFTDRLEEIGGWESEAYFLRESALGACMHVPEKLRIASAIYENPAGHTPYCLLMPASVTMIFDPYDSPPNLITTRQNAASICYRYGVPYDIRFSGEVFPNLIPWLRVLMPQLPLRVARTDIDCFHPSIYTERKYDICRFVIRIPIVTGQFVHVRHDFREPVPYRIYPISEISADCPWDYTDRLIPISQWLARALQINIALPYDDDERIIDFREEIPCDGLLAISAKKFREDFRFTDVF